jgi:hypothetical protein
LLDFWITWLTVRLPCGCASVIGRAGELHPAGRGLDDGCGVHRPLSSAQAATKGFIVEPGSKVSVRARLRSCAPVRFLRSPGT